MAREVVQDPIPFPRSFQQTDDAAAQSQAALLLTLGNLLRYEDRLAMSALAAEQPSPAPEEVLPEEDRAALNIPPEIFGLATARGVRFDINFVRERLARRGLEVQGMVAEPPGEAVVPALPELAETLNSRPADPLAAADLLQASLSSPDELVRVSAAASSLEVALPEQQDPLIQILVDGTRSEDETTRDVAATALARAVPGHPRLRELITRLPSSTPGEPSQTSLLVHGTWARGSDWWPPGGDFHSYVLNQVDPHLYGDADFFYWSGGWSDDARADGALRLIDWVDQHQFEGLDLFTHSHGGSVAMLASTRSLRIGRLVMMACPVHKGKYDPDFNRITKVVAVCTHMDLVILADGGGQRFNDPEIHEIVLPIWFTGHSATHDPKVWDKHGLPGKI